MQVIAVSFGKMRTWPPSSLETNGLGARSTLKDLV
jgi:hypothetical protein